MGKPKKVSIIISFYERLGHLKCCLESLRLSESRFQEVIIADDGSSAETVDKVKNLVASHEMTIRHIWRPKDGFRLAATRNNGIRNSCGDYLVFIDCDFLILPDTLTHHLEAAKPGRFIAGGCKYLTEEQTEAAFSSRITTALLHRFDRRVPGRNLRKEHLKFIKRTLLFRLRLANPRKQSLGGHFSVYRRDIERVNGYDENFVGWGGEDEDLGIRMVKAGIYCRSAIRSARVLHMWHPRALGETHWRNGPNIQYFKRKRIPYFCANGLVKMSETGD